MIVSSSSVGTPLMVSTVLLTRNSMRSLPAYFSSMRGVDDILVMDGGSTDGTVEYARSQPNVRVIPQRPEFLDAQGYIIDFSGMRNAGYALAKHPWILCIDADEEATPALLAAVRRVVEAGTPGVYFVKRRFSLDGRAIVMFERSVSDHVRLFHLSCVRGCVKPVHERLDILPGSPIGSIDIPVTVPLAPARSLRAKYDRFLRIEIASRKKGGIGFGWWLRWVLIRNMISIARMSCVWVLSFLIPRRGPRFPFGSLWEQVRYLWVLTWRLLPRTLP